MLSKLLLLCALLVVAAASTGCEIIGDIFQAGVWVGVILVVIVLALIMFLVSRVRH
jgi:hypothetical protein